MLRAQKHHPRRASAERSIAPAIASVAPTRVAAFSAISAASTAIWPVTPVRIALPAAAATTCSCTPQVALAGTTASPAELETSPAGPPKPPAKPPAFPANPAIFPAMSEVIPADFEAYPAKSGVVPANAAILPAKRRDRFPVSKPPPVQAFAVGTPMRDRERAQMPPYRVPRQGRGHSSAEAAPEAITISGPAKRPGLRRGPPPLSRPSLGLPHIDSPAQAPADWRTPRCWRARQSPCGTRGPFSFSHRPFASASTLNP